MASGIRWSPTQLAAFQARMAIEREDNPPALQEPPVMKPNKYRNQVVEVDGIKFDSKKEAGRWAELVQMQEAGLISDLRRQVAFELAPSVKLLGEAKTKPALRFIADFTYVQDGKLIVFDVKSAITRRHPVFRLKAHLLKTVLGLDIHTS